MADRGPGRAPAPIPEHIQRGDATECRFLRLAPNPGAPSRGRRASDWLGAYLEPTQLDDALLLVSELISNSVLHAELDGEDDWIRVSAIVLPDCVRVEISDSSPGSSPEPPELPPPGDVEGRGLWLVERLADAWGTDGVTASRVWFELRRR